MSFENPMQGEKSKRGRRFMHKEVQLYMIHNGRQTINDFQQGNGYINNKVP
jgi:hypothetical protein